MIDKVALRNKVKQAINIMPYKAIVTRLNLDSHNEPIYPPVEVCPLTGYRYLEENKLNVILRDSGEVSDKENIQFLVDWNEDSILVRQGDFIEIEGEHYKIKFLGNTNEICFIMKLEEI